MSLGFTSEMKTALILVSAASHFVELSRVAEALASSRRYRPVIWLLCSYSVALRDVDVCRRRGWEFEYSFLEPVGIRKVRANHSLFASALLRLSFAAELLARYTVVGHFLRGFLSYRRTVTSLEFRSAGLFHKYHPDIVIACEDNVGYGTNILIKKFQAYGVPSVLVPYTISNAAEAAEAFFDSYEHQVSANSINRWAAKNYPHWVFRHRDRDLLRLPASAIISMERAGYSPVAPWSWSSTGICSIAVENNHMLSLYKREGLPDERLIVTGALYDDTLAESGAKLQKLRAELDAELGLEAGLPLLLCAWPPSQFPRDCEFSDYASLTHYWAECLSRIRGWSVIVRPHPRLDENEVDHLRRLGLKVSMWDTARLIPVCDLYVASVSATIRWAIACGKPVVNYDVYRMKYMDYADVKGVLTVSSKEEFQGSLYRLTADSRYHSALRECQMLERENWGCLDGKASVRLIHLFDNMIARRSGHESNG